MLKASPEQVKYRNSIQQNHRPFDYIDSKVIRMTPQPRQNAMHVAGYEQNGVKSVSLQSRGRSPKKHIS